MNAIKVNLKQSIVNRSFFFAAFGVPLILFLSNFGILLPILRSVNGQLSISYYFYFLQTAISSEAMQLVLPIAAALPFTSSYFDDLHSGFIKVHLPRTGYKQYIMGKLIGCFSSGGLAPVMGVLLFSIISGIVFLPKVSHFSILSVSLNDVSWIPENGILLFFSGAFWSLLGMTASALTNSKHMAYAAPFILFYVLVIMSERYFKNIVYLNPKTWIVPDVGIWGIGLPLFFSVFVSTAFAHFAGRRLRSL